MSIALHPIPENLHALLSVASATTTVVIAAVAQKRAGIYRMILTVAGAQTIVIQDTASTVLSQTFQFGANGGSITLDIPINGDPWWNSGIGLGIQFVTSTAAQTSADVWYMVGP
jgi:hypothetical protein